MTPLIQNRSASYNYRLLDKFEAGIRLTGSEVKSLRSNHGSLCEAFLIDRNGELFLHNAHIPEYAPAQQFGHQPKQDRKILLHKRQINKIIGSITRKGMTAVPLKVYLNEKGRIKLEIALAVGLKKADKRQTIKEKEWNREQHRILRQVDKS